MFWRWREKHFLDLGSVVVFVVALGFWLKFGFVFGSVLSVLVLLEFLMLVFGVDLVMILSGSVSFGLILRGKRSRHRVLGQY